MTKPTIIFVPGLWEGPTVYSSLAHSLSSPPHNYPTVSTILPSTGKVSPANQTLQADVAAIRAQIEPVVEAGRDVILVMHSAGGFLGSNAIEGLSFSARSKEGKQGGVKKLVFLAAGLLPAGTTHADPPFFEKDGTGRMHPVSPRAALFSDLSDEDAATWLAMLQCQPAEDWNDVVTYAGWKDVPSIFLVAEEDRLLPPDLQRQFAVLAGSEVVGVRAGHMVMLSQPEKCLEIVLRAASEAL